jgi:periplasmic protein TonB
MASNNASTPPVYTAERAKNFLAYGFAISIVLHVLLGPFLKFEKTQVEEDQPQKVTVVRVPTPPPTPPPTPTPKPTLPPTPPPKSTPPPNTPAPQQPRIKINTQKTESKTNTGPSEATNKYTTGNTQGIPQGQGTAAPVVAPAATPAPAPTPQPTRTPLACSRPNVPASTIHAVEPDTPPIALQQGVQGVVQVVVSLNENSRVTGTLVRSSPSVILNNAALSAARQSTFQTEVRDCKPIAADYIFSVEFTSQ